MASVTQRIREIKQPYGGYLPVNHFTVIDFNDGKVLNDEENVSANIVGMCVDYLSRYMIGFSRKRAFDISLKGASFVNQRNYAEELLSRINGVDEESIIAACKLVGYDVCVRSSPRHFRPVAEINPDENTISNIKIMVLRSVRFFQKYGNPTQTELTFEGGYTDLVTHGDGDFLTKDTLWDFKVSKTKVTSKHTLQILMYYIMSQHSIHDEYKNVKNLGLYNPRTNRVYLCAVDEIPKETIDLVSKDVLGYSRKRKALSVKKSDPCNNEYTVQDICMLMGQSKHYIYQYIDSGELLAHKRGNKYFIYKHDFEDFKEEKEREEEEEITNIHLLFTLMIVLLVFMLVVLCFLLCKT